MKIFVVLGMPASGKNIARIYAEKEGIPYYATGDIVRAELKKRDIKPDPGSMARLSDELRGQDGMGVTRLALDAALNESAPAVFLEGMRSMPEIKLIRDGADCTVVAFVAPAGSGRNGSCPGAGRTIRPMPSTSGTAGRSHTVRPFRWPWRMRISLMMGPWTMP